MWQRLSHLLCMAILATSIDAFEPTLTYASVEYLYWEAWPETLPFATDGLALLATQEGHISVQPEKWDSGVRASLGRVFCVDSCAAWSLELQYTRFKTKGSTTRFPSGGLLLYPTDLDTTFSGPGPSVARVVRITDSWGISYQVADLSFQKEWSRGGIFGWSTYGGVRAAWISSDYHLNVPYSASTQQTNTVQRLDNSYYGLQSGVRIAWHCLPWLSLHLEGGGAILWGHTQGHFAYSDTTSAQYDNMKSTFDVLQPVFDGDIGIEYGRPCCLYLGGPSYYGVRLSWDFHYWLHQSHLLKITAFGTPARTAFEQAADLYVQGLSVKVFLNW